MGRTKDYDDYIDWTYDIAGLDPNDYDNYDAYVKDVIGSYPPVNYDDWKYRSKTKLKGELTDYFKENRSLARKLDKAGKRGKVDVVAYPKGKPQKQKVSMITKVRRQVKSWNRVAGTGKPLTKTERKRIDSIADKRISGKKYTKGERTVERKLKAKRANEIYGIKDKEGNRRYTQKAAWKLMHREFRQE